MKSIISILVLFTTFFSFSQGKSDTSSNTLPDVYLDEVIVFGEKKVKRSKLGYLNKENFTLSLYKNYEIGVFIPNDNIDQEINDIYLKVNNELLTSCDIQINFYKFDNEPKELIKSIKGKIDPSNSKKQIISTDQIIIDFPLEGIFVSTKILSDLDKEDDLHFRVYLTERYESQATFIRGSIYGNNWTHLSKLNIGSTKNINACYGLFATK